MSADKDSLTSQLNTLDVLGVGLSVEMFRQSQVWQEMKEQAVGSMLPTDAVAYTKKSTLKVAASIRRCEHAFESAAKLFVENWPIPCLSVWPRLPATGSPNATEYFRNCFSSYAEGIGMPGHKFAPYNPYFNDHPEDVLERVFQFFDGHPNVPVLLLMVCDGDMIRAKTGDASREKYWGDGPRHFDSMAESSVALMLGRRERVNAAHNHIGSLGVWTREQFQQFDRLPTIGQLHRPIRISYRLDKDGHQTFDPGQQIGLMSARKREDAFKAGLELALRATPDKPPARVFYDTGGPVHGANVIPLAQSLTASLPDFELFNTDQGYDISMRIGNTGAASPFVQWALAIIAGFHKKDVSLTVNLRQKEEAMITVVTASNDNRPYIIADPIDFHLAHGRLAYTQPASVPAPQTIASPKQQSVAASAPSVPIGTRLSHGNECPQSGIWRCDPPDANAGPTHYIPAGRVLPQVKVARELSTLQKLRGESVQVSVGANWTLMSYEKPTN